MTDATEVGLVRQARRELLQLIWQIARSFRSLPGQNAATKTTAVVNLLKLDLGTLIALQALRGNLPKQKFNAPIISCPPHSFFW
jgi:hypothetical protein